MVNIPNRISLIRIGAIPIFLILLELSFIFESRGLRFAAAISFVLISLTDMVDGYVARKMNQVTQAGMMLDPIADKLLMLSALVFLTNKGVPAWMTFTLLVRELLVVGLRTVVGDIILPASKMGKAKTFFLTVGVIMLLFLIPWYEVALGAGIVLSIVSGWDYYKKLRDKTHKVRVWD